MDTKLQTIIALALESGADAADAILSNETGINASIFDGEVDSFVNSNSSGIGLRVICKGQVGYAYTEKPDEDLHALVQAALASAAVSDPIEGADVYRGVAPVVQAATLAPTSAEAVIEKALALYQALENEKVASVQECEAEVSVVHTRFASSAGIACAQTHCTAAIAAVPVVQKDDWTDNGFDVFMSEDLATLDHVGVAQRSVQKAWQYQNATCGETGRMPVVFSGEAMADLLASMMSSFSAEQAEKGLSLLCGREGSTIAAPVITLIDSPIHPAYGFAHQFDGEGVPVRRKNVIDKGRLTTLLHSVASANRAGVPPTGNAVRGYATPVAIAPMYFYFEPGANTPASLCEKAGNGVLIRDVSGLHAGVNATSGEFSLLAKGFHIQNGVKAAPIAQMVVSGNFFRLLEQIEAVGNDLSFAVGKCGSPSMYAGSLTVAANA